MAFPRLLLTPTILKSLIEKVNVSQILADHAQHSFAVSPRGFTKGLSQTCLSFPSGLQTELRRSGACSTGRTHAELWRPVCIRSQTILTNTQHVLHGGTEQWVCCLEVFSLNAGFLATRSCFFLTPILRALV